MTNAGMHHPVLQTLLARLRAFEALERSSFALATIDAMMEPFERHRTRIDVNNAHGVLTMGECNADMFGAVAASGGLFALFRAQDRDFLERLVESLIVQEMGCHFGATSTNRLQVPVALEGLLLPEPPATPYGPITHLSLCLIRSDFPSDLVQPAQLMPMTLGPTRFLTLENRGPDRATLFKARWPRRDLWRNATQD